MGSRDRRHGRLRRAPTDAADGGSGENSGGGGHWGGGGIRHGRLSTHGRFSTASVRLGLEGDWMDGAGPPGRADPGPGLAALRVPPAPAHPGCDWAEEAVSRLGSESAEATGLICPVQPPPAAARSDVAIGGSRLMVRADPGPRPRRPFRGARAHGTPPRTRTRLGQLAAAAVRASSEPRGARGIRRRRSGRPAAAASSFVISSIPSTAGPPRQRAWRRATAQL